MHSQTSDPILLKIEELLPPIFTREEASRCLGGIMSAKTLKNIDCKGTGPQVRRRIGKKVAYERASFMYWLEHYQPYGKQ